MSKEKQRRRGTKKFVVSLQKAEPGSAVAAVNAQGVIDSLANSHAALDKPLRVGDLVSEIRVRTHAWKFGRVPKSGHQRLAQPVPLFALGDANHEWPGV